MRDREVLDCRLLALEVEVGGDHLLPHGGGQGTSEGSICRDGDHQKAEGPLCHVGGSAYAVT